MLVIALVVGVAGGWESYVRMRGLDGTTIRDSAQIWSRERERAALLGDAAIILVGASRMQMGIDLGTLERLTGRPVVQLAISAAPFLPVLESLADDPRVSGTIVVSVTMQDFLSATRDSRAALWVEHHARSCESRPEMFHAPFEELLQRALRSRLVSFEKRAYPQQLLFDQKVDYVRTLPDRSQRADYRSIDRDAAYRRRVEVYLSGREPELQFVTDLTERFERLERSIDTLEGRGADVVLVRFPSTRRIWEMDEILYPKALFWDALAAHTSASTVHFREHPELSAFDLPDGVHLDYRDTPAFTAALASLIWTAPPAD